MFLGQFTLQQDFESLCLGPVVVLLLSNGYLLLEKGCGVAVVSEAVDVKARIHSHITGCLWLS